MDQIDHAFMVQERLLAQALNKEGVKHDFTILHMDSDGLLQEASFTGSGGGCVDFMDVQLGIDFTNGRWARGHDRRSVKASDGEMEEELKKRLPS